MIANRVDPESGKAAWSRSNLARSGRKGMSAGEDPVPGAGEEQQAAGAGERVVEIRRPLQAGAGVRSGSQGK